MLVITRYPGQSIIVNDQEIIITVLGMKGNQVRIGIDAPPDVSVHREEIYERIKANEGEGKCVIQKDTIPKSRLAASKKK